jgi:predicted helicase
MDVERLRSIKTFPSLVKYLRDELDWPIESDDFDELTFDYEPGELGLDAKTAVNVKEIKQLRPLASNQPWGIFFINFEPKRLPVVVLRRILRALVLKKRQSANKSQQATWNLHDLLFISSYGESDHRDIAFAHFAEEDGTGDLPTLRVLGWDDEDTVLHLADADQKLREKLRWPEDSASLEDWRSQWSSAFTLRPREVIGTSKALAKRMAELATAIRKRVNRVLSIESENGALRKLMAGFREALIHDLTEDDFADTYAQTITYGLLTARVSRPAGLVAENVRDMVPITNPFLRDMLSTFLTVGGRKGQIDFDELGINEVVQALRDADMEAVMRDFGDRRPEEDPVIHFYEDFLKEYDAEKRIKRGVFFTPRPVVSFIVRSVDESLRKEFGLEDGLADTTTWGEMVKRCKDLKIPEGVKSAEPFVRILDPACGTGTFLVEVIDVIYATMRAKWRRQRQMELELDNLWNEYVAEHLLPRLYGFELMMAPYAIAHMKIGLKLHETGYSFRAHERARIYLTNTLEEPKDFSDRFEFDAPALAHEAHAVNSVKRRTRFSVVIGNPPYSVATGGGTPFAEVIMKPYLEGLGVEKERKKGVLQDDYIRFFRYVHWQVLRSGAGTTGLITNNSYLDGTIHRAMRKVILDDFSSCCIVNLNGSGRAATQSPDDENVFDILQGVATSQLVKSITSRNAPRSCCYASLLGSRASKYERLLAHDIEYQPLSPAEPYFLLRPLGADELAEFRRFVSVEDMLCSRSTGIETEKDHFAVDFDLARLERRLRRFLDPSMTDREVAVLFGLRDTPNWNIREARSALRKAGIHRNTFVRYLFHPFDWRFTYYSDDLVTRTRRPIMEQMASPNLALLCLRQIKGEEFAHAFVTRSISNKFALSSKSSNVCYHFPLYTYVDDQTQTTLPRELHHSNLTDALELPQVLPSQVGGGEGGAEVGRRRLEDVLAYVYAILYCPAYRARFAGALKIDFPRIPKPTNYGVFFCLSALGADLVALHLLENDYAAASWNVSKPKRTSPLQSLITKLTGRGGAEVAKGYPKFVGSSSEAALECGSEATALSDVTATRRRARSMAAAPQPTAGAGAPALQGAGAQVGTRPGRVYINPTCYFEGVPENVWNFHVGGYQVCEKWLKDRRGRTLSDEDVLHYQRAVVALKETIRLMAEIDRVIEAHGGWPGAFVTK